MTLRSNIGSWLLNRLSWALKAGLQFQGKRDLYAVFGWRYKLQFTDFLVKYARQGVATRIIDAPVDYTWLPYPCVEADKQFKDKLEALAAELNLWNTLIRADKLAGIGRYCLLFIGYDDIKNSEELRLPVKAGSSRKVMFVQPYGEDVSSVASYNTDPSNPRYGRPELYNLNMKDPSLITASSVVPLTTDSTAMKLPALKVHHSRIVHIAEGALEDDLNGIPRLMPIYNDLDDLMKVTGGSSEAFWLNSNRGMQADIDKEMELDPTDAAALEQEMEDYQHELRRIIRTRGVKLTPLGSDAPNPTGAFRTLISILSFSTGIPTRILLGSETGSLASQQDRINWAAHIMQRRLRFAEPRILLPFLASLVRAGVLSKPQGLTINWADPFILSPLEKAQTMAQTARSAVNFAKQFAKGNTPITSVQEARTILGLTPETEIPAGTSLPDDDEDSAGQPAKVNPDIGDPTSVAE